MIIPASIFTVTDVEEGILVSLKAGTAKVFGAQSSKKNPIVLAVEGSVGFGSVGGGLCVVSCPVGRAGTGSTGFLEQANKQKTDKKSILKK
jgi:hypothetical protein